MNNPFHAFSLDSLELGVVSRDYLLGLKVGTNHRGAPLGIGTELSGESVSFGTVSQLGQTEDTIFVVLDIKIITRIQLTKTHLSVFIGANVCECIGHGSDYVGRNSA